MFLEKVDIRRRSTTLPGDRNAQVPLRLSDQGYYGISPRLLEWILTSKLS